MSRLPFARKTVTSARSFLARLKYSFWIPPASLSMAASLTRRDAVDGTPAPRLLDPVGEGGDPFGAVEPGDARLAPQPGSLPLRQPPRRADGLVARPARIAPGEPSAQHLAIADRLEGVRPRRDSRGKETVDLLAEAGLEEGVHPGGEPLGQDGTIEVERELHRPVPLLVPGPGAGAGEALAPRLARGESELQRADDPLAVPRSEASGARRVQPREERVEPRGSPPRETREEPLAERLVARRGGDDPLEQTAEIHAGPAGDDRHPPARGDRRDGRIGALDVDRERAVTTRIGDVDHEVAHAVALLARGLPGRRVEAAVDLDRVAGDDLSAETLGEGYGESGLSGPGGAGEDEERRERGRVMVALRALSR